LILVARCRGRLLQSPPSLSSIVGSARTDPTPAGSVE